MIEYRKYYLSNNSFSNCLFPCKYKELYSLLHDYNIRVISYVMSLLCHVISYVMLQHVMRWYIMLLKLLYNVISLYNHSRLTAAAAIYRQLQTALF